jgi:hypothetical protein
VHQSLFRWMQTQSPRIHLTTEDQVVDTGHVVTTVGWKSASLPEVSGNRISSVAVQQAEVQTR